MDEGDIFKANLFRRSLAELYYLGFIEEISPDVKPDISDKSKVDVVINLKDERRTEVQLSGGYSSVDRFIFSMGLSEHNFFGRGQTLNFSASMGAIRQIFQISFTEPWLMDTPTYFSTSIFNTQTDYEDFTRGSLGASLTGGRNLAKRTFLRMRYQYEVVKISDISKDISQKYQEDPKSLTDEERAIIEAEGRSRTSGITLFLINDTRDNPRDPSRGRRLDLVSEYAGGILQGDNNFYKYSFDAAFFIPLVRNIVFGAHGRIAYADSWGRYTLPVFERYHLGGENSIRGTGWDSFGPRDRKGKTIGGNKLLQFNTELIFPLAGPLKGVLFFDAGDVYPPEERYDIMTVRKTVGAEIRFYIPSFWVPIRFIWGYNLDAYDFESRSDFQFGIGTIF